jgi:hypothetical protein
MGDLDLPDWVLWLMLVVILLLMGGVVYKVGRWVTSLI